MALFFNFCICSLYSDLSSITPLLTFRRGNCWRIASMKAKASLMVEKWLNALPWYANDADAPDICALLLISFTWDILHLDCGSKFVSGVRHITIRWQE